MTSDALARIGILRHQLLPMVRVEMPCLPDLAALRKVLISVGSRKSDSRSTINGKLIHHRRRSSLPYSMLILIVVVDVQEDSAGGGVGAQRWALAAGQGISARKLQNLKVWASTN
jgi:hypothetical protein